MIRRRIIGVLSGIALLFTMGAVTAPSAQAVTDNLLCYQSGGYIYNDYASTTAVRIYSGTYPSQCGYGSLPRIQYSFNVNSPNFKDTDAFYVGPGYQCRNRNTNYIYYGNVNGTWFWLEHDGVRIFVVCGKVPGASSVPSNKTSTLTSLDSGDPEVNPGPTPPVDIVAEPISFIKPAATVGVGNVVYNRYDSTGNVYVTNGSVSYRKLLPDWDSLYAGVPNVTCFYPTKNARSQWGGIYYAFVVRCFQSGYNTLILKVG